MRTIPLHWKIIFGMLCGVVYGLISVSFGFNQFTLDWIVPFGDIFLNLLKVIAVPLIIGSIISGVASIADVEKLSRIGGKTIGIYIVTTAVAISIGLLVVNVFQPGAGVPKALQEDLYLTYEGESEFRTNGIDDVKSDGPLAILVKMIPENIVGAAGSNANMLQVVIFSLLFGVALVMVPQEKGKPLISLFEGLTAVIVKGVQIIMLIAPIGVFALIAKAITQTAKDDISAVAPLLMALGFYCSVVLAGLFLHAILAYSVLLKIFTRVSIIRFFRAVVPAQLLAFSTSSSAATLPVTMEVCEKRVGVSREVSSFVLPLGATINMDGTALYQAVAAVFIGQVLGIGFDLSTQLQILFTAIVASIGAAAVPGAGLVILVIILEAAGVPSAAIGLILGVDRILDMCRTAINVTGDATVATVIAGMENELNFPDTNCSLSK